MNLICIRSACFFALVVGLFCLAACADSSILSGKLCDEEGRCLPGYACDPATNRCVPEGQLQDGDGDPGDAGAEDGGGLPDGDFGGPDGGDVLEVDRLPEFILDPSNLDGPIADLMCGSAQALVLNGDATIDTESGVISGSGGDTIPDKFQVVEQPSEYWPDLAVFTFDRVEIAAGARLTAIGTNVLVILACSEISISGVLDVSGSSGVMAGDGAGIPGRGGPGGSAGGDVNGGDGLGFGGGQGGAEAECNVDRDSGGAGGGFGGVGGAGGDGGDPEGCGVEGPEGESSAGGPRLVPLSGGSGGGGGGDLFGGPGGGGGGAVQLGANQKILVAAGGGILAGGGGGAGGHDGKDSSAGGGGGSGGAVLLEAREVVIGGTLSANGGGGGAGYKNNNAWTDQVADGGTAGQLSAEGAPGGDSIGIGGVGGPGSGGFGYDGHPGQDNQNGGGGGGGAGRIRINTQSGSAGLEAGAVLSPSGDSGECTGLCGQGTADSL